MDTQDVLRKLRPILGEGEVQRAWEQMQLADPKIARLIELRLRKKLAESTGSVIDTNGSLIEPVPERLAQGAIAFGNTLYGSDLRHAFGLRPEELLQHLAVFGRSGAGKTNVLLLLLDQLRQLDLPFLVLDWKKNYRDLGRKRGFEDLVIYTVGRNAAPFFFNPLIPPRGVAPREWIKQLIQIMQHAFWLGEGVAFVLQEELQRLYEQFGVLDGAKTWPTFRDLQTRLRQRKVRGREATWMESTMRAVGALTFGAIDWVLNAGAHFPMQSVLRQRAVLEMDALTNTDKTFLVEALLLWIHHHRMHEAGREKLKHVLVIEEAHHVLLAKKQDMGGAESPVDVVLREVRELGQGIVLADQMPGLIGKPAIENTHTTVAMNLKEKGDVTAAAKAMLLETEQARYVGQLPVGVGMVKLQSRWMRPFLVRFPLFPIKKGVVSDGEIAKRYRRSLDVQTVGKIMRDSVEAVARLSGARAKTVGSSRSRESVAPHLRGDERQLLDDVLDHPFSPVADRYSRLGLTARKGTTLVSRLVDRELIKTERIPVPGTSLVLLDLTPRARLLLGLLPRGKREGNLEHRYWIDRIAREVQAAGVRVEREVPVGEGRTVDLVVTVSAKRVAIEVETGKSDWQANLRKCARHAFDRILIAATRREALRMIQPAAAGGSQDVDVVEASQAAHAVRKWKRNGFYERSRSSQHRTGR